jgi:hypothetical protein
MRSITSMLKDRRPLSLRSACGDQRQQYVPRNHPFHLVKKLLLAGFAVGQVEVQVGSVSCSYCPECVPAAPVIGGFFERHL